MNNEHAHYTSGMCDNIILQVYQSHSPMHLTSQVLIRSMLHLEYLAATNGGYGYCIAHLDQISSRLIQDLLQNNQHVHIPDTLIQSSYRKSHVNYNIMRSHNGG